MGGRNPPSPSPSAAHSADGYHTAAVRMSKELWRKCQLHRIETGESFNALAVSLLENEFSDGER